MSTTSRRRPSALRFPQTRRPWVPKAVPVQDEHGEDRATLDSRSRTTSAPSPALPEIGPGRGSVRVTIRWPGREMGQVLGESLDESEDDGLPDAQRTCSPVADHDVGERRGGGRETPAPPRRPKRHHGPTTRARIHTGEGWGTRTVRPAISEPSCRAVRPGRHTRLSLPRSACPARSRGAPGESPSGKRAPQCHVPPVECEPRGSGAQGGETACAPRPDSSVDEKSTSRGADGHDSSRRRVASSTWVLRCRGGNR